MRADAQRDLFMATEAAKDYGIIDAVYSEQWDSRRSTIIAKAAEGVTEETAQPDAPAEPKRRIGSGAAEHRDLDEQQGTRRSRIAAPLWGRARNRSASSFVGEGVYICDECINLCQEESSRRRCLRRRAPSRRCPSSPTHQ